MAKRKTPVPESACWKTLGADPRLVACQERIEKAEQDYQRWFSRLKRAMNKMERCRRTIASSQKRLTLLAEKLSKGGSHES